MNFQWSHYSLQKRRNIVQIFSIVEMYMGNCNIKYFERYLSLDSARENNIQSDHWYVVQISSLYISRIADLYLISDISTPQRLRYIICLLDCQFWANLLLVFILGSRWETACTGCVATCLYHIISHDIHIHNVYSPLPRVYFFYVFVFIKNKFVLHASIHTSLIQYCVTARNPHIFGKTICIAFGQAVYLLVPYHSI